MISTWKDRLFHMGVGGVVGCLLTLVILLCLQVIGDPCQTRYTTFSTIMLEAGEDMPADKKNEMIRNLRSYLAETIINSREHVHAPSELVADYSFVMDGYDTFVVYCRDEIIGVLTAANDITGQRIVAWQYTSVPFSLKPNYVGGGPISAKPGWMGDKNVYR